MIGLLDTGDEFSPHLLCDVCRKPIIEVGNIEWNVTDNETPTGPLLMAHKECSWYLWPDGRRPDCWMPLGWLLGHLVENARADWSVTENFCWLPETHSALPQVRERQKAFPAELDALVEAANKSEQ